MKHGFLALMLTLVYASCGSDGSHFKLEGRMKNMNQGEFYIYDAAGSDRGVDTIKVQGGRFAYEAACEKPYTLVLVFPNFSQQPVFAEPGKTLKLTADASHLSELKIEGSDENELMNTFREAVAGLSPPQTTAHAETFIADHPASAVSVYLLKRYFVATAKPDYQKALRLATKLKAARPEDRRIKELAKQLQARSKASVGMPLPKFSAKDIYGRNVSSSQLKNASGAILVWASWSYPSLEAQRRARSVWQDSGKKLKLVSLCADPSRQQCKDELRHDSIPWPVICDEKLLESQLLRTLALYTIPGNIVFKNGKIIARDLKNDDLDKALRRLID